MAGEAVKKLIEAEQDAALLIDKAKAKAKEILASATEKGEALLMKEGDAASEKEKALLSEAEKAAFAEKGKIEEAAAGERDKLCALAAGKMEAAVSLITERVVNG